MRVALHLLGHQSTMAQGASTCCGRVQSKGLNRPCCQGWWLAAHLARGTDAGSPPPFLCCCSWEYVGGTAGELLFCAALCPRCHCAVALLRPLPTPHTAQG